MKDRLFEVLSHKYVCCIKGDVESTYNKDNFNVILVTPMEVKVKTKNLLKEHFEFNDSDVIFSNTMDLQVKLISDVK